MAALTGTAWPAQATCRHRLTAEARLRSWSRQRLTCACVRKSGTSGSGGTSPAVQRRGAAERQQRINDPKQRKETPQGDQDEVCGRC